MKIPFAACTLAALPLLAAAAEPAADPAVPVPPASYRSVFQDLPKGVEEGTVDWRRANAEVGQFPRGHVDILRWEQRQGGASAPRAPASGPAAAAPADHQHEGH